MTKSKLKLFAWRGINPLQQKQQGKIIAFSDNKARQILLHQGFQQIRLQRHWQLTNKVTPTEVCAFMQQLATLLNATVPLKQSLQILLQNTINLSLYQWLLNIIQQLETGSSLSQALQQSTYLTHQEQQLIKVGELTGKLAQVCAQIAEHKAQSLAFGRKIQKILLYPSMVLAISLLLTIGLLIFIVPQFAQMYSQNQAQLPAFTQLLLWLSGYLQAHWVLLSLFPILIFYLFKQLKSRSPLIHHCQQRIKQALPIFGKIIQLSQLVSFCRNLCLMLQSGIPLNQALQSFLPQTTQWQPKKILYVPLQQEITQALNALQQGYNFSQSVSSFFPSQAQQMLQVGEQSGQLGLMLQAIAQNYQQQLDHQIDLLSQMLEPMLMLIIGAIIGLIMLGMYMPIFNMGALIQ